MSCAHRCGGSRLKRFVLLGTAGAIVSAIEGISPVSKTYTEDDWDPVGVFNSVLPFESAGNSDVSDEV